ncbi:MAG: TraB/VirB10 family protein [Chlamydiales bacterium]|nr:TraB/VirB10 family protein [Chlamydiales bacterium]MBY0529900.1 TraB/VirB10 family protein [Rhabdochlamydiaceae bacterium]
MEGIKNTAQKIAAKQKRLYIALLIGVLSLVLAIIFLGGDSNSSSAPLKNQFETPSQDVNPEDVRLTILETLGDVLSERTQSLEKSVLSLKEEKTLLEREKDFLIEEAELLKHKMRSLEEAQSQVALIQSNASAQERWEEGGTSTEQNFCTWEAPFKNEDKNVLFEIPAGTVVKAVLVSGADCTVAVQKPTGPNMVLLRTLDYGRLPKKVRVALKGGVIVGNAIGDLASERVYVRAERITLVEPNGNFVETEVSAYISGEDGREGMRGIVVDRSGQIMTRAFFASFMQGVGDTLEGYLNNQTIEKLSGVSPSKTILNLDMLQTSALQGSSNAFNKFAEYYIKRAEQLQPAIQIAAGRIVDVVFVKTVKIGEVDLKKKLDRERELRTREYNG